MTTDGGLPVLDPAEHGPRTRSGVVVGVLLAAGTSTRFGERNKLLAEVDGTPIVRQAAKSLIASEVDAVVAVVGYESDCVRAALDGLDLEIVENPHFESGQASSLSVGVDAARARGADAAVFALGDMPTVTSASIDVLVAAYHADAGDALAAAYEGERGNPVLFASRFFDALADVDGDTGGRTILLEHGALVETDDPGVVLDVDTPADLHAL